MKKSRIAILVLSCFLLGNLFSIAYCTDNAKNDTLALVDQKAITTEDFITAYKEKMRKVGLTDNVETRVQYLRNLISDELLIAEAKNQGLDKTETAQKEYKRIRLQELLNTYTIKHISPGINITEDDLAKLYAKFNTKVKVSHLYAATKEKADSLYRELMKGKKFEDLARENFNDTGLKNNGGSVGYIAIDEMDPDFEKAAFSMNIGKISKPVKTVEGYSIIRVEDIKSNPLLTENEFLKVHDKLKAFARKRAFEEASKQYANSLREKLNTKFNDEIISKIFKTIADKSLLDFSEAPSSLLHEDLNKTVVYSGIGNWSLKRLIDEMNMVSDKQRKFIRTKENLEDVIAGLVNREYIEQKAVAEGLDRTPAFQKNVRYNFETFLLATIEKKLKDKIRISPDSVKSYYADNINLFTEGPTIRLSSILVDNQSLVDSIKFMLDNGESFDDLAKKYSIQRMTAEDSGDMGYFKRSELDDLADEVFALEIGQWAGPFSSQGKYVFLKCTDLTKPVTKSFDETKKDIELTLISFKWFKERDKYVESLKKNISYQMFPKKLYDIKINQ